MFTVATPSKSEAIGGRSANRGACAQACRLPYELVVDGALMDLGDRAHLLSPQDLEASALVPSLAALGVSSLKIEGRLKGPEYVAASVALYRAAVDGIVDPAPVDRRDRLQDRRRTALLTYSRGSGPGFLAGVNHQQLVEARTCDHRGLLIGTTLGGLSLVLEEPLARGDGVMIEGGWGGDGEMGGRVWSLFVDGRDVEAAPAGATVKIWLGPDRETSGIVAGRRVFKNDEPRTDARVLSQIEQEPFREPIDLEISGAFGANFVLTAASARGHSATFTGDALVEPARGAPIAVEVLRDKLGRLGESPFVLRTLTSSLPAGASVPVSALNRARRELVAKLVASSVRHHPTTVRTAIELLSEADAAVAAMKSPLPGLFVLCRNEAQATAALGAGADGVYLDFLDLVGTGRAVERLRTAGARFVGVAPPRIRKPGEEKIDRHLGSMSPDAILVRSLGGLADGVLTRPSASIDRPALRIGDFSLNVTNRLTAAEVLARGLDAFTPSFDLDADQLGALLTSPVGRLAEVVIHHPMPLFHMEHCVFAALLSTGKDYRDCGRPCEKHVVSLRDRAGMDHPIEADVGCRNTVFHAAAQSAAALVAPAASGGARRFRIELVRETEAETAKIVSTYRALIGGATSAGEVFRTLRTEGGYGVVRGTLRVL